MKNVTLLACLLVLTLGASAQSVRPIGPIVISPNSHNGPRSDASAITVSDHAVSAQAPNAVSKSATSGSSVGPVAKPQPPNAVQPPTARK